MNEEIKELKIEEQPKEKTFYIGVDDYESGGMYAAISEDLDDYILKKSRVFKIIIPTNNK